MSETIDAVMMPMPCAHTCKSCIRQIMDLRPTPTQHGLAFKHMKKVRNHVVFSAWLVGVERSIRAITADLFAPCVHTWASKRSTCTQRPGLKAGIKGCRQH